MKKSKVFRIATVMLYSSIVSEAFAPSHCRGRKNQLSNKVDATRASPYNQKNAPRLRLDGLYETKIAESEKENGNDPISDRFLGVLVLMTVPMAWGTYTPVVRYLYAIQPPVPGFVFSACYYTLAAITTMSFVLLQRQRSSEETQGDTKERTEVGLPITGGLELGSYLFIANCLQVIGLETVESDRAGFLVQFTTVMVPFVEALFAGKLAAVPLRTWLACVLAFLGLFVMGLDGKAELASDPISALLVAFSSFNKGDTLILGAAVLYTLHVVRLGAYAKTTTPMKLAASKATAETLYSFLLVLGLCSVSNVAGQQSGLIGFAATTGEEITSFFMTFSDGLIHDNIPRTALLSAFGAVVWTVLGKLELGTFFGLFNGFDLPSSHLTLISTKSPTNANLIYTFQPIFTALFAWALLGETMGPAGIIGGSIIATSVYAVASANMGEPSTLPSVSIDTEKEYL
eukprot:scaffold6159_cov207-Cylindrotheca_fusiformis.AAC.6